MKKVLSFVLVLSMILGSFGMAFAGNAQSDALSVLSGLGVFAGYTDGSMGEDKVVTRAEAATLIIKAMDLQDYAVGKTTFTDMDEAKWAEPFVAYAVSLGFVKGNTDGTFAPNATVTSDQMITMLVQALGYKAEYLTGGYPGAFVNTAKALGILEGVKSGAAGCTRGDVAQMIYNALNVPFVSYDSEGALQYTVLKDKEYDCFMERLIDDKDEVEGVVYGNEDSKINLKPYQGAWATLIYDGDDVVAVDDIESVFVTGDIEDGVLTLADDTEYKLERVAGDVVAEFVNGEYTTDKALTVAAEDVTLAVKTSGKFVTEVYSIAYWTAVEPSILWDEDCADALADDFEIGVGHFAENDDEEIDTDAFVLEGVASLDKIAENNVVTYYVNESNEIVKVEVGTEVVEGKITKVTKDDEYVINGKKYEAIDSLLKGALALNKEGEFFLNYAGKIAAFEGEAVETDYAVITLAADEESYGYDTEGTYKVKLMTEDGKEAVYVLTDEAYATLEEVATGSVISYALNKDGEIKEATVETLTSAAGKEMTAKGYLAGAKVDANAFVWTYDVEEDEFVLKAIADIPVNTVLSATEYLKNEDGDVVVVYTADSEAADDGVYGVVVDYSFYEDEDEVDYIDIVMLIGDEEVVYTQENDSFDYATDVLYEIVATGNELEELKVVADEVTPAEGTVLGVKDGNIKINEEDGYENVAADAVVYKWNADKEIFEASEIKDIAEDDTVAMFQMDSDDEDGFDIVLFVEAE